MAYSASILSNLQKITLKHRRPHHSHSFFTAEPLTVSQVLKPCGNKFAYPPEIARPIVREIEAVSELVFPTRKIAAVKADPYDNLILECAVKAGVDYVVSGDNHLLELRRFEGILILSPAEFLKALG